MWVLLTICSALFLGLYDVAKKKALAKNSSVVILFVATALSTLFLSPWLWGSAEPSDYLRIFLKSVLVTLSWVSGMIGLKRLPITTVSTIKGSRPMFVLVFSLIFLSERLSLTQWVGVLMALVSLFLLTGIRIDRTALDRRGLVAMAFSVFFGVASALYDKRVIVSLEPLFLQAWANLFVTADLALCLVVMRLRSGKGCFPAFRSDPLLVVIAVLITLADALYFFAIKQPGALIGVVSVVRRCSILVSFVFGAIVFREKGIKEKLPSFILMMTGILFLFLTEFVKFAV